MTNLEVFNFSLALKIKCNIGHDICQNIILCDKYLFDKSLVREESHRKENFFMVGPLTTKRKKEISLIFNNITKTLGYTRKMN